MHATKTIWKNCKSTETLFVKPLFQKCPWRVFFDINALNSCEAVWNWSSHVRESRMVLDSEFHAVDSGFQVLYSSVCQQDSGFQSLVGFWIPRVVFQIPGTLFQCLSVGFWIPIFSGIQDSLSCIPDSRYSIPVFVSRILDSNRQMDSGFLELYSGFHKQNFPRFRNPESLTWCDTGKHRVSSKFGISLYSLEYLSKMKSCAS